MTPATRSSTWVIGAIVAMSLVSRSVVTVVSATLPSITRDFPGSTAVAALTAMPLPAFAVAGLLAPRVSSTLGTHRTMLVSAILLATASAIRPLGSAELLVAGTLVALLLAALQVVILPDLLFEHFPSSYGSLSGMVVAVMSIASATASASIMPLYDRGASWRLVLLLWSIPSFISAIAWLPARGMRTRKPQNLPASRTQLHPKTAVWPLTLLFAFQAGLAFTVMGWLPTILASFAVDEGTAGAALAGVLVIGIPASLVAAKLAAVGWERGTSITLSVLTVVGLALLPIRSSVALVLAVLALGLGFAIFPVVLVLITRAGASNGEVAGLSGRVQGIGYALAAPIPLVFGMIAQSLGWTTTLTLVIPLGILQAVFCWLATTTTRTSGSNGIHFGHHLFHSRDYRKVQDDA